MKTKKKSKLPKHYTAKLSRKDKKKQEKAISKSKKSYQKGKYYTRPKMKSFKNKKSSWTQKFHELYPNAKSLKEIEKVTGIPKKALMKVKKKEWVLIILQDLDRTKPPNLGVKRECMLTYLVLQRGKLINTLHKNTKLNLNTNQIINLIH